jgi:putative addiction module component (TIGR02574 family)
MAVSAKKLFENALSLNDRERAELVGLLLSSFEGATDDGVEAAWVNEVSRRIAELDSGVVQMIPWSKVKSEAFKVSGT